MTQLVCDRSRLAARISGAWTMRRRLGGPVQKKSPAERRGLSVVAATLALLVLRRFGFLVDRRFGQFRECFVRVLLFRQGLVEQLHGLWHSKLLRPGLERAVA
jgi:hypothetical protein